MTQNIPSQSQSKTLPRKAGDSIHVVLTIGQLLEYWEENGRVEKDKIEGTRKFLTDSK